jgi:hypothetical protein
MRPFDLNVDPSTGEEGYNPQGEWDRWHIESYDNLVVHREHEGDPRLYHQPTYPNGDHRPREPLRYDGGPIGLFDVEGMRAIEAASATATWSVWARFSAEHPVAEPLSAFCGRYGATPGVPSPELERAKRDHLTQPLVQALAQYAITSGDPSYPNSFVMQDPVALFACGKQEYVERAAALALPTHALLTVDGQWADPWNASPLGPIPPDESKAEAYWRLADAYLRGLNKDQLIMQVRCHC